MKCPICVADLPNTSHPNKKLPNFRKVPTLCQHWIDHHPDRVIRRYYARTLFGIDDYKVIKK